MSACISPLKADRNLIRQSLPQDDFIEIYCNSSLETCEARDVKGFYKRARAGEIKNYTGINAPYEAPNNPELVIDTENETIKQSVGKIIDFLKVRKIIA